MQFPIDLILLGEGAPAWPLGAVRAVEASPRAVAGLVRRELGETDAAAWLFWDPALGDPSPEAALRALALPGNVWHAGLRLGLGGLPGAIDFVQPTWMLNRDPDPAIEATSWRLSLRAALIGVDVMRHAGGPRESFQTLDAAGLELGHRYVTRGVLTRAVPWLSPREAAPPVIPLKDEILFLHYRFGGFWSRYAAARMALSGYSPFGRTLGTARRVFVSPRPPDPEPFSQPLASVAPETAPRVTVLVPTIDRYPYLRTMLGHLTAQTVVPLEVLLIDQTPAARREAIEKEFQSLPLKQVFLDRAGQCSSRNLGLQMSRGDYVLFLDDDDEVGPDLLEKHVESLARSRSDVSAGVADEAGGGPLPVNFTYRRASDVFPTNNCMIRKEALSLSGLFDLAYERGARADGDLGMRVYLSGALMTLDPSISVFHHHAPMGGLRTHKARRVTYASSRKSLTQRHLPGVTEVYLACRYFTPRQVRESLWLRALGTASVRGAGWKKLAKLVVAVVLLPDTWRQIRRRRAEAAAMLERYPQIPALEAATALDGSRA